MSFLYPAFLFGLFALIIPVLIHLFRFKRFKTVYFSNVNLLEHVFQDNRAQSRLKHWLILITRILAFILLVFAFAGPYLNSKNQPLSAGDKQSILFIDNSLSMQSDGSSLSLLDEAKQTAMQAVEGMSSTHSIYVFDQELSGISAFPQSQQEALYRIQDISVSTNSNAINDILTAQRSALNNTAQNNQRNYIFLSDFRTNTSFSKVTLDSNEHLSLVPFKPVTQANVSLDSMWFDAPFIQPGIEVHLRFKVTKNKHFNRESSRFTLKLNNEEFASLNLNWNDALSLDSSFTFNIPQSDVLQIEITATDDALQYDNSLLGILKPKSIVHVLEISNAQASTPAERVYSTDSLFHYVRTPVNRLTDDLIDQADFILITSTTPISRAITSKLTQAVKAGKNLALFGTKLINDEAALPLSTEGLPILIETDSIQILLDGVDADLPFYSSLFKQIPKQAEWPKITYNAQIQLGTSYAESLLKTNSGENALTLTKFGKGTLFTAGFVINEAQESLIHHPIFLPILYKMATYSAKPTPLYYTIGKTNRIRTELEPQREGIFTIESDKHQVNFIPEVIPFLGNYELAGLTPINTQGFYNIIGSTNSKEVVAFNYNRFETETNYFSTDSLKTTINKLGINAAVVAPSEINAGNYSQLLGEPENLWRYCLILVLLFLTAEALITRFIP